MYSLVATPLAILPDKSGKASNVLSADVEPWNVEPTKDALYCAASALKTPYSRKVHI